MTELFAQPYDITAQGFYFQTADEYQEKSAKIKTVDDSCAYYDELIKLVSQ